MKTICFHGIEKNCQFLSLVFEVFLVFFFTKWLKIFFSKLIFGWILRVSHVADTFKVEQTQKYVIGARNYAKM